MNSSSWIVHTVVNESAVVRRRVGDYSQATNTESNSSDIPMTNEDRPALVSPAVKEARARAMERYAARKRRDPSRSVSASREPAPDAPNFAALACLYGALILACGLCSKLGVLRGVANLIASLLKRRQEKPWDDSSLLGSFGNWAVFSLWESHASVLLYFLIRWGVLVVQLGFSFEMIENSFGALAPTLASVHLLSATIVRATVLALIAVLIFWDKLAWLTCIASKTETLDQIYCDSENGAEDIVATSRNMLASWLFAPRPK